MSDGHFKDPYSFKHVIGLLVALCLPTLPAILAVVHHTSH